MNDKLKSLSISGICANSEYSEKLTQLVSTTPWICNTIQLQAFNNIMQDGSDRQHVVSPYFEFFYKIKSMNFNLGETSGSHLQSAKSE